MLKSLAAHKTFGVLLTTIVLAELVHGIEMVALFPLYLHDRVHMGADSIGFLISSYLLTDILTRMPAGWGADRWARKRMILLGILLSGLPLLVMPRIESPALFLALNAINGIGAGYIWPAVYAAIADVYPRERYGLVLGIINMVMLGGIAAGPIVGGFLLTGMDYTSVFNLCFVVLVLALVLVLVAMREPSREPAGGDPVQYALTPLVRQVHPALLRLLPVGLGLAFALGMMLPVLSLFGRDVLHVQPNVMAWILIPPVVVAAGAIIPAGRWADRHGRQAPLVLGMLLVAIPFAGAPLSTNPVIVSAGATLAGLGYALLVPAWNALVMDYIPAGARGLFLGAITTIQGMGLALGPPIGGTLWERVGAYAPFEVAALLLGISLALALSNARRGDEEELAPRRVEGEG